MVARRIMTAVKLYMSVGRFWEPSIREAIRMMAARDSWKLCALCKGTGCHHCDRGWEIAAAADRLSQDKP
jgi:hypothetical protein